MNPHARLHTDATSAPSAPSAVDETIAVGASTTGAAAGFGPPAAAGEVGTLGPYRVVKELGKGGMGAVYAAIDTRLDRRLALKVMLPQFAADPAARERFLREARAAARVKHDNVVTVYEADERDGVPYIAMEYLEGYPLDEYLKKKGNPTPAQVLKMAAEAAAGLAAAHRQGLVHRDVKPGNLWLEAPAGRVKVLDFGLARPVDAEVELTKSGAIVGTPAYMSPEQARGEKVDHRTDLFSLGAVLYRLVTGRLPFQGPNTMAVLIALGTQEPTPVRDLNPAVPEPLAELIHQLLAKSVGARPASADEVVKRIRAMGAARTSSAAAAPAVSQVVYVPIQVTAVPDANPFADLDASATELEPAAVPVAAPVGRKPAGRWLWAAAGFAGMVLLALGGVVIVIRNKDGTETWIEVPDGATVTVKDKAGKTLAQVGPTVKAPAAAGDPDRAAAEYVVSVGGVVWIDGHNRDFLAAADLPKERFTLTLINLGGPKVTDAGLANFKGCKGLTWIDLGNSPVTAAGLAYFKDCKGLTHLGLGGNAQLTDAGLAHFKDCKGLTKLSLLNTPVTDAGLAHFKDCKGLTALDLFGTRATDAGVAHFKDCKGLTVLSLGETGVTEQGLAVFKECKGLTALNLISTKVTDNGLAQFSDCKGLTVLRLDATKVTDAGLAHFKDCKGLTDLWLNGTGVTDAGLAHVKDCKGLQSLCLNGTGVTDAGLAHFKDCKGLTTLWLDATKVTDAGLAPFTDCKALQHLVVKGAKVTAAGLAAFHAAVPGCRIEHDGGVIEPRK
ncbi:protein kinase domain-containing protein [Urbifossiella limnaea]|uniref:non-specific serine/threonine protein kinase n=1 Tax=Urbifossiella limnaea TaxID=2528023 RepID=A0A517XN39_9BACT|nr:protein kinase [Urbifossiella limnaea]QDU18924.1 Serine/threonine-protein kinase StkP [Urbifossiella limnaea]